jgi:hypothetical protein
MHTPFSSAFVRMHRLPIVLAIVIAGCERQPSVSEAPVREKPAAPVSKIVYRIEVLSDRAADASTFRRTVYFDGTRSAMTEQTNDYDFPGMTTIFVSGRDSVETYVKALPYFTFRIERERSIPGEMGAPVAQQESFTKTILGYRCRQLILETEQFRYSVWYTTDVTIHDPTQAVVQDSDVPGLILEMDKTLKGRNDWHTHLVVTAFESKSEDAAVLEIPGEAVAVADANEALVRNRERFEQAMQREKSLSWDEQQLFLGRWRSDDNKRRIGLIIERFGEAYTITEKRAGKPFKRGMARFYGNRLLHEQGTAWRTYFLDANGNLRSDQDEALKFTKQ